MKGLFIPDITAEMFRSGCLESIEALMAEGEIYDIDYEPEIKTDGDTISRRMAIDALEREKTYSTAYRDGYVQTDYFKQYNMGLTDGIKALCKLPSAQPTQSIAEWQKDFLEYINMLNIPRDDYKGIMEYINDVPSAQPEPRWIPVTEQLPEDEQEVLVTRHFLSDNQLKKNAITESFYVEVASRMDDEWSSYSDEYKIKRHLHKVIAWMPLPKPYERSEDAEMH